MPDHIEEVDEPVDNAEVPEPVAVIRPTKKQRALLEFIQGFIDEHGYSPSYREIMNGCNYNSIATVAVHINNLITRGHLRKRDHSARSLELTRSLDASPKKDDGDDAQKKAAEAWLSQAADQLLARLDSEPPLQRELQTIATALRMLNFAPVAARIEDRLENKANNADSV